MMPDRHAENNVMVGVRVRTDWVARLDIFAQKAGQSRMSYVRQAVEERMSREEKKEGRS